MSERLTKTELAAARVAGPGTYDKLYVRDDQVEATNGRMAVTIGAKYPRQLGGTYALDAKACVKVSSKVPTTITAQRDDQDYLAVSFAGSEAEAFVIGKGGVHEDATVPLHSDDPHAPGPPLYDIYQRAARESNTVLEFDLEFIKTMLDVFYAEPTKDAKTVRLEFSRDDDGHVSGPIHLSPTGGEAKDRAAGLLMPCRKGD